VPLRPQRRDDRAQHEHVGAVREVDPDAHAGRRLRVRAARALDESFHGLGGAVAVRGT